MSVAAQPRPATGTRLSIIVPTRDEATGIAVALHALAPLRQRGCELIVVDGGSRDGTLAHCQGLADRVIDGAAQAQVGRARQMNAGAASACGDVLLFLHADTRLPDGADQLVHAAHQAGAAWGRFDVRIAGRSPGLAMVAAMMNLRSRITGIATGDQAMFVQRAVFESAGGFPDQPLMEDIELSRRLKRIGRPACLRQRAITSGRRWDQHGLWRTILLMWRLRLRYWLGASADDLAKAYR